MTEYEQAETNFHTVLGMMTASWAHVEFLADVSIGTLFIAGYDPSLYRTVPRSFGRKCQFIETALGKMEAFSPHRVQGANLMTRARELSKERNFLIHAIGMQGDEAFSRQMMMFLPGLIGIQRQSVSTEEIVNLTGQVVQLAHDLLDFYTGAFARHLPFALPLEDRAPKSDATFKLP